MTFVARQDAKVLVIERKVGSKPVTVTTTYQLDGSISRNLEAVIETISTAKWEGERLVIITTAATGEPGQVKRVMSLAADGSLVIETTIINGSAVVTQQTSVYRRAKEKVLRSSKAASRTRYIADLHSRFW
jgi:hypothetical protein